ncbi:hypothetical protein ACVIJ6_004807 [Bradyrhizobium sp. USDA 4369]
MIYRRTRRLRFDKSAVSPLRTALLAGRFRPALRFATRGLVPYALGIGLSVDRVSRTHRRARFLKPERKT